MSKMDNLRAMREARYEESQARAKASAASSGSKPAATATTASTATTGSKRAPVLAVVPDPPEVEVEELLCGHRNMSGRTCTREAGHSAKSHRYS